MQEERVLTHRFVETIPTQIEQGILYISVTYATAIHLCCCGCGLKVVTPITPTDWKLTFDGERVSLYPSIGNWGFPCQSHYWISNSRVVWAGRWSPEQITAGRAADAQAKERHFAAIVAARSESSEPVGGRRRSAWQWLRDLFSSD